MFTYQYKQPDEYHFSLDSIHFAEFVAKDFHSQHLNSIRVLDLCAGCGVIGFQLSWFLRELRQIDFVEIQEHYVKSFKENVSIVNRPELQLTWHLLNYDELCKKSWEKKYDLIVSNPPYFQAGHGMLSPSPFKNRCRFFLDSSFTNFIKALYNTLAPQGKAYFLLRPSDHHGYDFYEEMRELFRETHVYFKKITQIRGNDVVLIQKP